MHMIISLPLILSSAEFLKDFCFGFHAQQKLLTIPRTSNPGEVSNLVLFSLRLNIASHIHYMQLHMPALCRTSGVCAQEHILVVRR